MKFMKIAILAGGSSTERDVSLSSAYMIANALISMGHLVAVIDISEDIHSNVDLDIIFSCKVYKNHVVPNQEPNFAAQNKKNVAIGQNVIEACCNADFVFMALHGGIGENGTLQAILDCYNVKYTGSGSTGCMLAMDKDLSKRIMRDADIPTADWFLKEKNRNKTDIEQFPVFVKPVHGGSSIGVTLAKNQEELQVALVEVSRYEEMAIIEKQIVGREFSVGILGEEALPVVEIVPSDVFYDFRGKYQENLTTEVCPADLTVAQTKQIQSYALKIHRLLRLDGYSRIDFILSSQDGEFYCLEANALPGMTPTSLLPLEAKAIGISFEALCDSIIKQALLK